MTLSGAQHAHLHAKCILSIAKGPEPRPRRGVAEVGVEEADVEEEARAAGGGEGGEEEGPARQ